MLPSGMESRYVQAVNMPIFQCVSVCCGNGIARSIILKRGIYVHMHVPHNYFRLAPTQYAPLVST